MAEILWLLGFCGWFSILIYQAASGKVTLIGLTVFISVALCNLHWSSREMMLAGLLYLVLVALFGCGPIRRLWLTKWYYRASLKHRAFYEGFAELTETTPVEEWGQSLLSGIPDWSRLLASTPMQLDSNEINFLNGPVNTLLKIAAPWDIIGKRREIPPIIWQCLKREGFLGLTIPTVYGGHGFTNHGLRAILQKIAAVSDVIAEIVALANTFSATQLLIDCGTEAQREYYLPRFAKGDAISCLGLANPQSGTDLSTLTDEGIVCENQYRGERVLGLQLRWQKRYVQLAPVATEIAVLVRVIDPDRKLSQTTDLGLTVVLLPVHTAGVSIGRRHASYDGALPLGPCSGQQVFVPLNHIIGDLQQIGRGQQLIHNVLTQYRGVGIPACQLGRSKAVAAYTGAYARIRSHGLSPLSQLGGIAEKLAKITGITYLLEAISQFSINQSSANSQTTLISAITKYQVTKLTRDLLNEAIEIQSTKAVCLGPRNIIAQAYQLTPANICAGGGNTLLRSKTIIDEGGLRCHPHYVKFLHSLQMKNKRSGLKLFDQQLVQACWRFGSNKIRSFVLGLSGGALHWQTPNYSRRQFQRLMRLSSVFAVVLDVYLWIFGQSLVKQQIHCGRLADCISKIYLIAALLRNYHDVGQPQADKGLLDNLCQNLAYEAEQILFELVRNTPKRFWRLWLRVIVFPLGRMNKPTVDKQIQPLADLITTPSDARTRLLGGLDYESIPYHPLNKIHETWQRYIAIEPLLVKMQQGLQVAKLFTGTFSRDLSYAKELGLITVAEAEILTAVEHDRCDVLAVDDFSAMELNP